MITLRPDCSRRRPARALHAAAREGGRGSRARRAPGYPPYESLNGIFEQKELYGRV